MPKPQEREIHDAYKSFKAFSLKFLMNKGMAYNEADDLSDDIAGEAITRILNLVKKSDKIENITHYGLTISRNLMMDFFRNKGRADDYKDTVSGEITYKATPDNVSVALSKTANKGTSSDHSIDNEKTTLQKLLEEECWKKLSSKYQEVFALSIYKGMTAKLISKQLGESQNTVLTWMTKAKKEFIKCYWGEEANA